MYSTPPPIKKSWVHPRSTSTCEQKHAGRRRLMMILRIWLNVSAVVVPPPEPWNLSVLHARVAAGFIHEFLKYGWHGRGDGGSVLYRCSEIVWPLPISVRSICGISATFDFAGSLRVKYACAAADCIDCTTFNAPGPWRRAVIFQAMSSAACGPGRNYEKFTVMRHTSPHTTSRPLSTSSTTLYRHPLRTRPCSSLLGRGKKFEK